jgi:hypothetical protein
MPAQNAAGMPQQMDGEVRRPAPSARPRARASLVFLANLRAQFRRDALENLAPFA